MQPLISVIVPTYNAATYLPRTLDSILSQTYAGYEIIVVDDGSTDSTREVLRPYEERIRYLPLEPSGGPSRPRNVGVAEARGELVAIFDADDLMLPHKLEDAAAVFTAHPEVDLLFTNFAAVDADDQVIRPDFLARYQDFRDHLTPGKLDDVNLIRGCDLYRQLIHANFVGTSSVVARRAVLQAAGGFDEQMKNADDIDMWCRLAWGGSTFAFLDRVCHQYRIHAASLTRRDLERKLSVIRFWEKQRTLPLTHGERKRVKWVLRHIWINYARGLHNAGESRAAIAAYRTSLSMGMTLQGLVGLSKTVLFRSHGGWGSR